MARVTITRQAARQFDELPRPIRERVEKIMVRLERWPDVSGVKPLRGSLAGQYRVRTGDYRVQFRVQGEGVTIEAMGHRGGFYES